MKAAEVMVCDVITVRPEASLLEAAELLVKHRVGALAVVGREGKLAGVVSEGDLIRRSGIDSELSSGWLAVLLGARPPAATPASRERTVADVMTRDVIVASPDTPLRDIAAMLEKNAIKRVPIVQGGKLVGLVTRANLIQALATVRRDVKVATATSDLMIREDITSRLDVRSQNGSLINMIVHDGMVELWGVVRSEAEKEAIRAAAELTPGVRSVNDNLIVEAGQPRRRGGADVQSAN